MMEEERETGRLETDWNSESVCVYVCLSLLLLLLLLLLIVVLVPLLFVVELVL